ncbi:MAG: S41 family peptidase [Muribaculaceae bacterium]|nr:S41 family peptidase [Muribaculaceae bacterium]
MKKMSNLRCLVRWPVAVLAALLWMTESCVDDRQQVNDPVGNFNSLWKTIDTHYCFFREKGLDWDSIYRVYRPMVTDETDFIELYGICSAMLDELRDGHVNLISSFNTSYYRKWWTDYPQDFRLRTIQENYLDFNYLQTSGISYKMLPDTVGYMYYPSFSYQVGNLNLDYILAILHESKGLIIDIRDNGGGNLTNIKTIVSRLIKERVKGGSIRHKTGPGHEDFSEPYEIWYDPCDTMRISYLDRPVAVLTNRSCFSAANDFVSVMKTLPNVKIIGARTGGGGGLPFNSEMPIGWGVRFSACPMTSPDGEITEFGIDPSPGFEKHSPDSLLILGQDPILDFAVSHLLEEYDKNYKK